MPEGEFYACNEPERLSYTSPWEAAEEYLDGFLDPKMTVAEVEEAIRRPLTVTAYIPMVVTDSQIKVWSESLEERLGEFMADEHLDPDNEPELCEGADAIMLEAVTKIVKATRVWSCEESGSVELTGDQVLAWARKERPDWFEEPTT
jgi:hypothetical protein